MTIAQNFKESLIGKNMSQNREFLEDGSYLSPVYCVVPIHYSEICPQEQNPNKQVDNAFKALQQSILNTGYSMPVIVAENPLYDPTLDPKDKQDLKAIGSTRVVEMSDPAIRRYYKYTLVDGSHRFNALLQNDEIFKRENGYMPCSVIRGKTKEELMSSEILLNSSRGTHSLDSIKDIVANLIEAGMSEEWISRNLYLDKAAIQRCRQLSGLTSAFNDSEGFSTEVWDPIKDRSEERKKNVNLLQKARQFVREWRRLANEDGGNFDIPEDLDLLAAAKNLGFDEKNPLIMPTIVDKETGEIIETQLIEVGE